MVPALRYYDSIGIIRESEYSSLFRYRNNIDLVFYNYILKCFVLIDLKIGRLTYQDIGQIDFYVRYFEDKIKLQDDNPTIGIVLCTDKNDTMAKYSVLSDKENLFASKYMLYLPTEEELKHELAREREQLERQFDEDTVE